MIYRMMRMCVPITFTYTKANMTQIIFDNDNPLFSSLLSPLQTFASFFCQQNGGIHKNHHGIVILPNAFLFHWIICYSQYLLWLNYALSLCEKSRPSWYEKNDGEEHPRNRFSTHPNGVEPELIFSAFFSLFVCLISIFQIKHDPAILSRFREENKWHEKRVGFLAEFMSHSQF